MTPEARKENRTKFEHGEFDVRVLIRMDHIVLCSSL